MIEVLMDVGFPREISNIIQLYVIKMEMFENKYDLRDFVEIDENNNLKVTKIVNDYVKYVLELNDHPMLHIGKNILKYYYFMSRARSNYAWWIGESLSVEEFFDHIKDHENWLDLEDDFYETRFSFYCRQIQEDDENETTDSEEYIISGQQYDYYGTANFMNYAINKEYSPKYFESYLIHNPELLEKNK